MNPLSSDLWLRWQGHAFLGGSGCSLAAAALGACPSAAPTAPSLPPLPHPLPSLIFLPVGHGLPFRQALHLLPSIHFSKEEGVSALKSVLKAVEGASVRPWFPDVPR